MAKTINQCVADALKSVVDGMPCLGQEPEDWELAADMLILKLSGSVVFCDKTDYDRMVIERRDRHVT